MSNLQEFVEKEKTKLEQEAEKYREEHDMKGFWIPEKGETKFQAIDKEPREADWGEGKRIVFRVKVGEEEKDWAVNPRNPVYRRLIQRMTAGEKEFTLLRTGEGKATRYEFLDKKTGGEQQ